jgi:hypothetical protein
MAILMGNRSVERKLALVGRAQGRELADSVAALWPHSTFGLRE